jgi:hypothetical protein
MQMVLYNCITLRLGGGRPTADNLREVKYVLAPLFRQQMVHEVTFPRSPLLALLQVKFVGILLPRLRELRPSPLKGDATIAELATFSDDDFFRFVDNLLGAGDFCVQHRDRVIIL